MPGVLRVAIIGECGSQRDASSLARSFALPQLLLHPRIKMRNYVPHAPTHAAKNQGPNRFTFGAAP